MENDQELGDTSAVATKESYEDVDTADKLEDKRDELGHISKKQRKAVVRQHDILIEKVARALN
ncbi:hypothetical protein ILUMI_14565 [Ignelater luminosus]|uniref:Uncharacterized protein n=1 Tax=Ignelater luminosus TaxID=2038154 RepID=A0A8K0CQ77_IGNLU|nr:hypothetical protein ILUMI_14565 [Ignelater luminosus]